VTATLRAFCLIGPDAVQALDWLHVHGDVRGALEADSEITVWLPGALPSLPFAALTVRELPADLANATATGLERDAAILVQPDLLVRPPWVARPADFVGVELVVPRGMAFGSGEHGSTKAALRCLHAHWSAPASFADVGTGSGILLLYAAVRGCPQLSGCDIEVEAVAAARALVPQATVVFGGPEALPGPVDSAIANLSATELHAALPALLAKWTRRGPLVLSGLRAGEEAGMRARLPAAGAAVVDGDFRAIAVPAG
jgi:ribosomal protein L11 methylase PrmA